jgi:hypothetical protein
LALDLTSFSYDSHEATAAIWQETFLSALLRAILYSDDSYYRLAGYRKIDPITSLSAEAKFLEAAESLFWQGKVSFKRVSQTYP